MTYEFSPNKYKNKSKKDFYIELSREVKAYLEDDFIANLANVTAILNCHLTDINWVGFYLLKKDILILGPFQGRPACVKIPLGKGVCGTSAAQNKILRIDNVHEFPGHIACDKRSQSEIVIPLSYQGKVWGVLDIDAPILNRFDQEDEEGLHLITKELHSPF